MSGVDLKKRSILKGALGSAVAFVALKANAAPMCGSTPQQIEGPFYPEQDQLDKDTDLTQGESAAGEIIMIDGIVMDEACNPIKGALVEIWQACHTGRYNHAADPNTAALDPNFQYWGQAITDENGAYRFKTVIPGAYPAGPGWVRPPHIHYKVARLGYHELTTQLYFSDQELNRRDRILLSMPARERAKVVVDLMKRAETDKHRSAAFNISLKKA